MFVWLDNCLTEQVYRYSCWMLSIFHTHSNQICNASLSRLKGRLMHVHLMFLHMLSNDFSLSPQELSMESGIDPGQDYYMQDYYNYDHGWVSVHGALTPKACLNTCSFSSHSASHTPHTRHLNSGAQTEVILDSYLEYMSCSMIRLLHFTQELKSRRLISGTTACRWHRLLLQ